MKAGTTWLYSVLARHPELHFAMEKEIHYFNHRYVDNSLLSEERRLSEARERYLWRFDPKVANIDAIRQNLHWVAAYLDRPVDDFWYRNLFQLRKFQTYACDFSNLNAHLPVEAWPVIASKCDSLRVLFTMRDPVKRLWSHTKFHLQVTGELEKLDSWSKSEFEAFIRQPHIWNNGEYGAVLRRLSKGLSGEQYKAIFYEDLHDNQRSRLREIEAFLGIAPFDYPQAALDRRLTESKKREMPGFFADLVSDDVARIRKEVEDEGYVLPLSWG
ncbi:sulfotransferase [Octadecabacter ascidiaceicola]|nr:sulfotransferase [Octadecabacter ascidiaceicola]